MILIDEPAWPAHGTLFGHLVSDTSLTELHAFARAHGIPARGFDHDHYDVPVSRFADLVGGGAVPVPSSELLRRLVASGLRVRPAERTPKRHQALDRLTARWEANGLGPGGLRTELLVRWSEPHRRYHDVRHLANCLAALDQLSPAAPSGTPLVELALWFHDAVYASAPGQDEEDSARLTAERLTGLLPARDVVEVVRLVRLTASHLVEPDDHRGALLVDADLAILGALPGRYHVYARDVRLEYEHLDEQAWATGRSSVLRRLLARDPLFITPRGRELWQDAARSNLAAELDELGATG